MKMLKILFACYGKKTGILHVKSVGAASAFQMLTHHCHELISDTWSPALFGNTSLRPVGLTRFAEPRRSAPKISPPPWITIGGDKRRDVARLSTGAPGSQPTLWNWPPRNICQTRLLALTSSADAGAAFRRPRRGSVLLSTCGCACVRRGGRKRKGNRSHWGNGAAKSFCCTDVRRKVDLNWPPTPGEKKRTPASAFSPSHDSGFVFSVVDFSATRALVFGTGLFKMLKCRAGYSHRNTWALKICVQSASARIYKTLPRSVQHRDK